MDFFKRYVWEFYSFVVAIILVGGFIFLFAPPSDFPSGVTIVINRGTTLSDISKQLSDVNIVRHSPVLNLILRISGMSSGIKSGTYLFKSPENIFVVAHRLINGDYGVPLVRITFPEGVTVRDISKRIAGVLPMSAQDFISTSKQDEGYLFPDTYLFAPDTNIRSIIETMRANFDKKIALLADDIKTSGHSISDIVIMASMVEKEARTVENRRIVAGILWNRLSLGMPLQVDAVFGYIFNRDTYSPSFEDLKVDSPYNTYTHKGLPPGPICNPGLESIQSALYPTKTNYLYYLTGSDDQMHYARTYTEHQANQRKYLH